MLPNTDVIRPQAFVFGGSNSGFYTEVFGSYMNVPGKPYFKHESKNYYLYSFTGPDPKTPTLWVVGENLGSKNGLWIGPTFDSSDPPTAVEKWFTHSPGSTDWVEQPDVAAVTAKKPRGGGYGPNSLSMTREDEREMLVARAHECWKLASTMRVECEKHMTESHVYNTRTRLNQRTTNSAAQLEDVNGDGAEPPDLQQRTSDYFYAVMYLRALLSEGATINFSPAHSLSHCSHLVLTHNHLRGCIKPTRQSLSRGGLWGWHPNTARTGWTLTPTSTQSSPSS